MGATVQLAGAFFGLIVAIAGLGALAASVQAMGQQRDLSALLWLSIGGLLLKGGHDLLDGDRW